MLVANPIPSDVPAISEDEAVAAERALAIIAEHPKGTDPRQINKMMTRLALAYPNAKLSIDEAAARLELYGEMLSDIDEDVLASGFRAAVKTCKFFPSISEIRELAMSQRAPERMIQAQRLRILLAHHANAPAITAEPYVTPDEAAAIKAELGLSAEASALIDRIVGDQAA